MNQKECDNCFEDVTKKIDQVVNVAKNAIVNMNYEHSKSLEERDRHSAEFFASQEKKHNDYLESRKETEELRDKIKNRRDNLLIVVITLMCSVIGYNTIKTEVLDNEVDGKANAKEVLRLDDAKDIRELGDRYYDQRYVIKNGSEPDPVNYKQFVETLFERASRGSEIKNSNN